MTNNTLPPILSAKWGMLPHIRQRGPLEWSAACPSCGDYGHSENDAPDRFRMFAPDNKASFWRGWCRRCGYFAPAEGTNDRKPSDQQLVEWEAARLRMAKEKEQLINEKIRKISDESYWRGFHDGMDAASRSLWHQRGVTDYLVDTLSLGYVHSKSFRAERNGEMVSYNSAALTIPYLRADGETMMVENLQFRILNPPEWAPHDRYRLTGAVPPVIYRTEPERSLAGLSVLVIEGAIKTLVVYNDGLLPRLKGLSANNPTVVGVPFKSVSQAMVDALIPAGRVTIALDPDAYALGRDEKTPAATRFAAALRKAKPNLDIRMAHFIDKPDDLIVNHGKSGADYVMRTVRNAIPYL